MSFSRTTSLVPSKVGRLQIRIVTDLDVDGVTPLAPVVVYELLVLDAQGNIVKMLSGDLLPQLTGAQVTTIGTFMTAMRTKANAEAY